MYKTHFYNSLLLILVFLLCPFAALAQDDDIVPDEPYKKVRLHYTAYTNFQRQLLLGFQNANATEGIDPGYDAINFNNLPNDIYFLCNGNELFIQGVGYFNIAGSYGLGVKSDANAQIVISLLDTENFNADEPIYIYDNVSGVYFNLKTANFVATVNSGTTNDRFSLRFMDTNTLGTDKRISNKDIIIGYDHQQQIISVRNELPDVTATAVLLYNMLGQQVGSYNIATQDQHNISVPIDRPGSGTFIVNIVTNQGIISKKILLR